MGGDGKRSVVLVALVAVLVVGAVGWFVFKGDGAKPPSRTVASVGDAATVIVPSTIPSEPLILVFVTTEAVPKGSRASTLIAEQKIEQRTAPVGFVTKGGIASKEDLGDQVLLYDLPVRVIVDSSYFIPDLTPSKSPAPPTATSCTPTKTAPATAGWGLIVVAAESIPAGMSAATAVQSKLAVQATAELQNIPPGVVGTVQELCNQPAMVAAFPIAAGSVLVAGMFVAPGS